MLNLTQRQRIEVATAWLHGGSLALGNWGARNLNTWSAKTYGLLVLIARDELADFVDYSAEKQSEKQEEEDG